MYNKVFWSSKYVELRTKITLFAGSFIFFNSKKSADESHRLLSETNSDYTPPIKMCEYWFKRFKNADFDSKDKERPGHPKKNKSEELEMLFNCNIPTFSLVARRFSQPRFGKSGGVGDAIIT